MSGSDVQVLEFELASETYCVDISYVAEIVDMDDLTPIPNAPPHIEGVMDLRGRTTSIVNPKRVLDIEDGRDTRRIIVFDPDRTEEQGAIGWMVDEVDQVVRVPLEDAEAPPSDDGTVEGIVKRDDEFTIWISPESINA